MIYQKDKHHPHPAPNPKRFSKTPPTITDGATAGMGGGVGEICADNQDPFFLKSLFQHTRRLSYLKRQKQVREINIRSETAFWVFQE